MSARADPFDVARDEVEAAVRRVQFMHREWRRLLENENTAESQRFQDLHAELVGELQLLDYDLQEIDRSIVTVEENRERFQLTDDQLAARKAFMRTSRAAHQEVHDSIASRKVASKLEDDKRQALLSQSRHQVEWEQRQAAREEEACVEEQLLLQRKLIDQQDDELLELTKSTQRLVQTAQTINNELECQQGMLDDLNVDMDRETDRMNFIMKGVGKMLKTGNSWHITIIIALMLFFVLCVLLIVWT